ncbi:unnamed protein product [Vitrella brassicaformis CCMP3155]|uniref:Uncharacterized protein n=1 Tax=Vitrella brassicaformis (strain CCMP3155) TaxID=1169540 RepID=A0A0G4GIQ2_VITBC|nr:unnamed protein product [Vitrella brassicaformis CCMP3155]|eukprot:CEM29573.1 unnamed protein product [Vitrella brassicaformis CCMP3155]
MTESKSFKVHPPDGRPFVLLFPVERGRRPDAEALLQHLQRDGRVLSLLCNLKVLELMNFPAKPAVPGRSLADELTASLKRSFKTLLLQMPELPPAPTTPVKAGQYWCDDDTYISRGRGYLVGICRLFEDLLLSSVVVPMDPNKLGQSAEQPRGDHATACRFLCVACCTHDGMETEEDSCESGHAAAAAGLTCPTPGSPSKEESPRNLAALLSDYMDEEVPEAAPYGYPDAGYFHRATQELRARGIIPTALEQTLLDGDPTPLGTKDYANPHNVQGTPAQMPTWRTTQTTVAVRKTAVETSLKLAAIGDRQPTQGDMHDTATAMMEAFPLLDIGRRAAALHILETDFTNTLRQLQGSVPVLFESTELNTQASTPTGCRPAARSGGPVCLRRQEPTATWTWTRQRHVDFEDGDDQPWTQAEREALVRLFVKVGDIAGEFLTAFPTRGVTAIDTYLKGEVREMVKVRREQGETLLEAAKRYVARLDWLEAKTRQTPAMPKESIEIKKVIKDEGDEGHEDGARESSPAAAAAACPMVTDTTDLREA